MPLPLIIAGAAIGAGVGSYGHDNWGWNKDAIWQGAGVGVAGGYAAGGILAGPTGATTTATGTAAANAAMTSAGVGNAVPNAAIVGGAEVGASTGFGTMEAGMLGMGALSAFAGGSSGGFAPQEEIKLTGPGEDLYKNLQEKTEERLGEVQSGNIQNLARHFIPGMYKKEGMANRAGQQSLTARLGASGDKGTKARQAQGRGTAKQALGKAGARVDALRTPGEWMGTNIKEQYSNVIGGQQNLMNLEQQAPMLQANASLAQNSAQLMNRASQGSAFANLARMGGMMTIMNKVS